ncbi:MAG TPA: hypothetical protein DCP47_02275 [Phycisphaerales bacterium]|nr:hypothetical protein [Phycisphaerales bacterium]
MSQIKCLKCGKKFDNKGLLTAYCSPCKIEILTSLSPYQLKKLSKHIAEFAPKSCKPINLKQWIQENSPA